MTPDDVPAASAVGGEALAGSIPAEFLPSSDEEARGHEVRREARVRHILETDPDGSWVAEAGDGEVVGVALAIVRDGIWGLSLLGVKPGLQGQGIGGRLLAGALRTLEDCRGGIILSSTDPRALRRYARAGFALRPCVSAAGPINRARIPAGLRSRDGSPEDEGDRALLDAVSRHVRGASHVRDVPRMLDSGGRLLVHDDRDGRGGGWAVVRDGAPIVLAAREDAVAADLLWSCFAAGTPGATVHVDFIAAGQDWAVEVALDMGLTLGADGPVFVRGQTGTLAPYLPSGAFL